MSVSTILWTWSVLSSVKYFMLSSCHNLDLSYNPAKKKKKHLTLSSMTDGTLQHILGESSKEPKRIWAELVHGALPWAIGTEHFLPASQDSSNNSLFMLPSSHHHQKTPRGHSNWQPLYPGYAELPWFLAIYPCSLTPFWLLESCSLPPTFISWFCLHPGTQQI